jgi:Family of unknown function (DUF6062)
MPSFADPDRFLEILQPDRCPLCFLVRSYAHEHLKSLLDESATDPHTRSVLLRSRGFCRRHAWQAVDQRQALGLALIYQSLLEGGLEGLPRKSRLFAPPSPEPCPLCESEKLREKAALQEFVLCWRESGNFREAFRAKGILCLRHLDGILAQKMAAEDRRGLEEAGRGAIGKVRKDLAEFLDKQDYHRSGESMGAEWDAWIQAVRMVSGERE